MLKILVCCGMIGIFGVKSFAGINPDEKKMIAMKKLSFIGRQQIALQSLQEQLDRAEDDRNGHLLITTTSVITFVSSISILAAFEKTITKKIIENFLWASTGVVVWEGGKQFLMFDQVKVRLIQKEIDRAQEELALARETYESLKKN